MNVTAYDVFIGVFLSLNPFIDHCSECGVKSMVLANQINMNCLI